jgi:hypothetical protein
VHTLNAFTAGGMIGRALATAAGTTSAVTTGCVDEPLSLTLEMPLSNRATASGSLASGASSASPSRIRAVIGYFLRVLGSRRHAAYRSFPAYKVAVALASWFNSTVEISVCQLLAMSR